MSSPALRAFKAHNELARALNAPYLHAQSFARLAAGPAADGPPPGPLSERLVVVPEGLARQNPGRDRYFAITGLHTYSERSRICFTSDLLPLPPHAR